LSGSAAVAAASVRAETVRMNNPMQERRERRRELLRRLYAAVDGSVSEFINAFEIGATLGLDEAGTRRIFEYLEEKGWVMVDDHRTGIVRVTAEGVDEVESGTA
jgi:hypothetical protein